MLLFSRSMKTFCSILLACSTFVLHAQDYSLDKKLGAENAVLIEQEMGLYKHDSLQWLINAVGQKLVSRLKTQPFDFHFYLADSEEPNAFALPGGYIYVTRGILPLLQTEDELAGVMAHEIIHVMQRHSVKQLKKGAVTNLLKVPGNVLNAVTGTKIGNVLNAPIGIVTSGYIAKYGRGHEKEADDFGIQLAASAGYKTDALADALDRLSKEIELLTGEAERHNYFSDHPYTPSRISNIRGATSLYKPINPAPVCTTASKFTQTFHALCFGPNPEQGLFIDNLFIHPNLYFSFIAPSGWLNVNKPTMVASQSEKGDAMVTLSMMAENKSPRAFGEEAKEKVAKEEGLTIQHASDTVVNSLSAYAMKIMSKEKKDTAWIEIVWVTFNQKVFQIMALAKPDLFPTARKALYSFKQATAAERQQVMVFEMQVVPALGGETIAQLSERSNNRLVPDLTLLFNNVALAEKLPQGKRVKIVVAKPY